MLGGARSQAAGKLTCRGAVCGVLAGCTSHGLSGGASPHSYGLSKLLRQDLLAPPAMPTECAHSSA